MSINKIKFAMLRLLMRTVGWFYPIKKKVVFNSFFGKQYSCNPRAISDEMHKLYPDYEIVWLLNDANVPYGLLPDYVRVVVKGSRIYSWGKEIVSAAAYVYNIQQSPGIYKKKKQFFVQTWHGDRGFKKILRDIDSSYTDIVYDNKVTDVCIGGSDFGEQNYRSAFGFEGNVLSLGSPRNDCLIINDVKYVEEIKRRLNLAKDVKILLYAPTFRDNNKQNQSVNIDLKAVCSSLEKDGEKWVCLIRSHIASDGLSYEYDNEKYINVSDYPDMADLLCITDMLITDYSSCACDFSLTGKPIILTFFDINEYITNCREFKVEPEETGFKIAHNQDELNYIIENTNSDEYKKCCDRVNSFFGVKETGKASRTVCELIDASYIKHFVS